MRLEVNRAEQELLVEMIEGEQKRSIHELDHADARDYKAILRDRLTVLDTLLAKLQGNPTVKA
ncbi:MAG TPA: hypothetical protein VFY29_15310 [Terriglobia bacterium]|nr:hypothetical protein [Terriglobia bacterium]